MDRKQSFTELRKLFSDQRMPEARDLSVNLTLSYPLDVDAWMARADLHFQLHEYDSFIECSRQILHLTSGMLSSPRLLDVYRLLADKSYRAKYLADAIDFAQQVISMAPDDAQAHYFLGACHLMLGNFHRGWPEFEWRLKTPHMAIPAIASPLWDGRSIDNMTILIITDQGYGDAIQFVRYVRYVKTLSGKVILICRPQLNRLLAECPYIDHVINIGDHVLVEHDVHIPIMSLPGLFQSSLKAMPSEVPYLRVPSGAGVQAIPETVRHAGKFRVGLVWASHAGINSLSRQAKSLKSIKKNQFSDIFNITGIKFFSLQKDDPAKELNSIPTRTFIDLGPYLEDFADTAAVIQELDLVISVDTAVAHLAGALGKPVWTLLPFVPDWRWMLEREDTPWYPTMRLFRQPAPGDWTSVIKRVSEELKALVKAK